MIKLYLNNTFSIPLESFTRNTNFTDNILSSHSYCTFKTTSPQLYSFLNVPITSFQIKNNDNILYDAGEITAHIISVDENLIDEGIGAGINIQFDMQ